MEENKIDINLDAEWVKQESDLNAEMWDPELSGSKELAGKLCDIRDHVGANDSTVYTFEKADGSKISVWGSTVLDAKLKTVELGTTCKIVFLGRQERKDGKGKPYKNWEVYTRK